MNLKLEMFRFLAGRGRLEVLGYFLEDPARRESINALARKTGIPVGTVWRIVHDLHDLGILRLDRIANAALVRVNSDSPAVERLRGLFDLDLASPHRLAYEHFAHHVRRRLPGVKVRLFGSVAAGTHRPSSDVDIEVVYGGSGHRREAVERACALLSNETLDRFGIPVTPIILERKMVIATE